MPNFIDNNLPTIADKLQIHKIKNVLRLQKGDRIQIFDQNSKEYTAKIDQIKENSIILNVLSQREERSSRYKINLAVAFPKGKRGDWIIEKSTELGVDSIFILETERSIMNPGKGRINKWKQIATGAAEQCGRVTVPNIERKLIEQIEGVKIVAVTDSKEHINKKLEEMQMNDRDITFFVGPEGDWTEQEIIQFKDSEAILVSLGDKILRVETASIVGIYSIAMQRQYLKQFSQTKT